MKKIFILLLIFNLNFNLVNSIEPDVFVQSTVNRASLVLSKSISKEQKIIELKKLLNFKIIYISMIYII